MANQNQQARAKHKDGHEIELRSHSTDTPILPDANYLASVENIKPGFVDWLMQETSKEAQARRDLDSKKISVIRNGQIFGFIFGLASLFTTSYLSYVHDFVTASIVGGTTIVTIVIAFIAGQKNK